MKYAFEAVNVIIVAPYRESDFASEESLKNLFPSLNVLQIQRLLQNYKPDGGEVLPPSLLPKLQQLCADKSYPILLSTMLPLPTLEVEQ